MGGVHGLEPILSIGFADANAIANVRGEDLTTCTGEGIEACFMKAGEDEFEFCLPNVGGKGVSEFWAGRGVGELV